MSDYLTLATIGRSLAPGQSAAGHDCPRCGSASGFSVFATDEGYGYRCHRDACGFKRFYQNRGIEADRPDPAPSFKPVRPYPFPTAAPDPSNPIWRRLAVPAAARTPATAANFGVSARVGFASEIVWRLHDFDFRLLGHVSRDYDTKSIRTWRATTDRPMFGYWSFARTRCLWIVEDPVSAARIAWEGAAGGRARTSVADAMALLGTNLTTSAREELAAHIRRASKMNGAPLRVVVALDPDAYTTAGRLVRELTTHTTGDILYAPLRCDPKDMDGEDLFDLLKDYHV